MHGIYFANVRYADVLDFIGALPMPRRVLIAQYLIEQRSPDAT